jgi:hypothetical protein
VTELIDLPFNERTKRIIRRLLAGAVPQAPRESVPAEAAEAGALSTPAPVAT